MSFGTARSTLSTTPSCAFQVTWRWLDWQERIVTCEPKQKQTWSLSQPHTTQYTGLSHCVREERSIPLRDQILTWPSSPPVARAVPEMREW